MYAAQETHYHRALAAGVPKELARLVLPVGCYTQFRVTAYLRNWLAFLLLRNHPDAQEEIREYAKAVESIVSEVFPRTWALFQENRA